MEMESLDSWVDTPSIHSGLSGLILTGLAFWASYMLIRLWQRSLAEDAAEAIRHAESLGLVMLAAGFSSRVIMQGQIDGLSVEVIWCGGALGPRTVVEVEGRIHRGPFVASEVELRNRLSEVLGASGTGLSA